MLPTLLRTRVSNKTTSPNRSLGVKSHLSDPGNTIYMAASTSHFQPKGAIMGASGTSRNDGLQGAFANGHLAVADLRLAIAQGRAQGLTLKVAQVVAAIPEASRKRAQPKWERRSCVQKRALVKKGPGKRSESEGKRKAFD